MKQATALKQAVQRRGWVTIPGGIKKTCGSDTQGYGYCGALGISGLNVGLCGLEDPFQPKKLYDCKKT